MTSGAERLRSTFTQFFTSRGHTLVPAAGLIPHHTRAPMFTNAGMNQFIPYFLGEETPPYSRATSVQKCVRVRGKHDDIELTGRTSRHGSFFEMLGNFSFGDYFKAEAIAFAWELLTVDLNMDPERLWVTVHDSDDEALAIWRDVIGVDPGRIQKLGDAENFWEMGDTGPCGPSSEISYDRGPSFGEDGGPAHETGERYLEIWNLVFMQYDRQIDGSLVPLPRPMIDTGFGLERVLTVLEDAPTLWDTTLLRPMIARAEEATGAAYGSDHEVDVALRVLADHARTMTFLISDGVFPTNEGRGYVLRRVIRRAVLRAQQLGAASVVMPLVVGGVIDEMGAAYPQIVRDREVVETVVAHEEEAFRRTLRQGSALLDEELASKQRLDGAVAFRLHDTYGFPIDLTTEIASERGVPVDLEGFEAEMEVQRTRARAAAGSSAGRASSHEQWREVLTEFGPTEFLGYRELTSTSRVLGVVERSGDGLESYEGETAPVGAVVYEIVLDETPFYAEGGGQIGDEGFLDGPNGQIRVLDTQSVLEGLIVHIGYLVEGSVEVGQVVTAAVDAERRAAIRRNHTATHLLQAALREVLGSHVKQQGSLVAPDRLRFDFSHFGSLTPAEIEAVERFVNDEVLRDEPVRNYETSRSVAEDQGAIAFFGEKYGDVVRVVEAGAVSTELCGGTHVHGTGMIGPFRILQEMSIGANTRRIFASTGTRTLEDFRQRSLVVDQAAEALRTTPDELLATLAKMLERERELESALEKDAERALREVARTLASTTDGAVVDRRDDLDPGALRDLGLMVRDLSGGKAVGLVGSPDGTRVAIVVVTQPGGSLDARAVASEVAKIVGGGGGGSPELATAGGRDVAAIDAATERLRALLGA